MEEPLAPSTAVALKRRTMSHLPLVRFTSFAMLLVAVDSLVCIVLWLAGGDSLYLEDSIKEFSFTHSTFDLVIIAALRGLILFGCFYFLERNSILSVSVKHDDSRKSLSQRFAVLCQVAILLCSGVSLINPRRMREGYGSRSVCLSVCLSVTELAAAYLVYTLKVGCH